MNNRIRFLILASLMVIVSGCATNKKTAMLLGQQAPYTQLHMYDGTVQLLDHARGKTAVVVFWASWCNNSRPVLEELNTYARTSPHRNKFVIYAVSLDKPEDSEKLREMIIYRKLDAVQHVYSGNEGLDDAFRAFRAETFPLVIVVGPSGVVLNVSKRADDAVELLKQL